MDEEEIDGRVKDETDSWVLVVLLWPD